MFRIAFNKLSGWLLSIVLASHTGGPGSIPGRYIVSLRLGERWLWSSLSICSTLWHYLRVLSSHFSLFLLLTVSGPLVGKYLSVWGVRAIFPAGFIIDGGTFILFGLLQWVDEITTFLVFSYIIRFIEVIKRHWTVNVSVHKSIVQILPLKAGNEIKGSAKMLRMSLFVYL